MNKINDAVLKTNPEINRLENMDEIKKLNSNLHKIIDIKEFREFGYLQELNRLFLHPLGLSLVVKITEEGDESILHIADFREEGISFDEELMKTPEFKARTKRVMNEMEKRFGK